MKVLANILALISFDTMNKSLSQIFEDVWEEILNLPHLLIYLPISISVFIIAYLLFSRRDSINEKNRSWYEIYDDDNGWVKAGLVFCWISFFIGLCPFLWHLALIIMVSGFFLVAFILGMIKALLVLLLLLGILMFSIIIIILGIMGIIVLGGGLPMFLLEGKNKIIVWICITIWLIAYFSTLTFLSIHYWDYLSEIIKLCWDTYCEMLFNFYKVY